MSVTFSINSSASDLLGARFRVAWMSKVFRISTIIAAIIWICCFIGANMNTNVSGSTWETLGVIAIIALLIPPACILGRHSRLIKLNPPGPTTYTISVDKFQEVSANCEISLKWNTFTKIVETPKDIVLYLSEGSRIVIQKFLVVGTPIDTVISQLKKVPIPTQEWLK